MGIDPYDVPFGPVTVSSEQETRILLALESIAKSLDTISKQMLMIEFTGEQE